MSKENNLLNRKDKVSTLPPDWKHPVIPGNAVQGSILVTTGNFLEPPETPAKLQWLDMSELAKMSDVKIEYDDGAYKVYKGSGHRDNDGNWTTEWELIGTIIGGGGGGGYEPDTTKGIGLTAESKLMAKTDGETIGYDTNGNLKVLVDIDVPTPDTTKGIAIDTANNKYYIKVDGTTITFDTDGKLKVLGGDGNVSSVNGKTGVVILKAEDIECEDGETIEEKLSSVADKLDNLSTDDIEVASSNKKNATLTDKLASMTASIVEVEEGLDTANTAISSLQSGKADASNVYTKNEVDTKVDGKFWTGIEADLPSPQVNGILYLIHE